MSPPSSLTPPRLWLAAVTTILLLGGSLVLASRVTHERAEAVAEVESHVGRVADVAARQVEQVVRGLQRVADIAGEALEETWQPAEGAAIETLALLSGLAGAMPGVVDLAVVDMHGRRVFQASTKTQGQVDESAGDLAIVALHRDRKGAGIRIAGEAVAGHGKLLVTRRIESLAGAFLGIVVLWFDSDDLVRLPAMADEEAVAVSTADGEMLNIGGDFAGLGVPPLRDLPAGWTRHAGGHDANEFVLLRRPVSGGLHVDVVGDTGRALSQWRDAAGRTLQWAALALVPFAALVWLVLREIRHREDVRRAAEDARRAELETMRGEARRLALVARHTGSAVIITAPDETIEWVNPAFTTITGYGFDEALGRHCGRLLQGAESDPGTRAQMRAALDRGDGFGIEILNYAKDGRRYWARIDCAPVRGAAGRIEQYIAIVADVTERKEQEVRLAAALEREREANALQRRFVSMASHEFRTPLAIIDSTAQRLASGAAGTDAGTRARVARIRAAVSRMTEMIDRTLSSARLDEGRISFEPAPLDLAALLRECAGRQRELSPGFEIALATDTGPLPIDADRRLMEQVVSNLLSNAVKYSGASRRIELCAEAFGDGVRFSVTDHGIGVPADEIDRLFTRYFRARTAMGIPGTGIGLNLVREFVEMHGGSITVRSQLGCGSVFTVELPAARPTARSATAAA